MLVLLGSNSLLLLLLHLHHHWVCLLVNRLTRWLLVAIEDVAITGLVTEAESILLLILLLLIQLWLEGRILLLVKFTD